MQFISLLKEIRAAIKARNFQLAYDKLVELLQMFSSVPKPEGQFKLLAAGDESTIVFSANSTIGELDAICDEYEGKSLAASDGELLKKIAPLLCKLLPLLLAGGL